MWAGATIAYRHLSAGRRDSVRVQVKPKVTLALTRYNRKSGKYFLYKSGRTVYAKGAMTPNHAKLGDGTTAGTVTVTAYQYKSRKWVKVKSAVRTLSDDERLHVVVAAEVQGHLPLGDQLRRRRGPRRGGRARSAT